jgi:hypothetical protein
MISGMEVSTTARIVANGVNLEVTLRNPGDQAMHEVWIDGGCLTHRTERFFDDDHSRTFLFTRDGLRPLSRLDRTLSIRSKYFTNPAWFDEPSTKAYEFFWGRSDAVPTEALVVSKPFSGIGAVGIAWDRCPGIRQNSDASHRCMHSSSWFGDLLPRESITRRGALLFGDTIDEVVSAYRRRNFSTHTQPPRP